MPSLQQIFSAFPFPYSPFSTPDTQITGIAIDNRKVQPGDLFVAMQGGSADGHDFIADAIQRGAAAVVGGREIDGLAVPYIQVENPRRALSHLAAAFYGNPGKKLMVIGVTGTDGKTTTSNLLYQILIAAGLKAGLISTVNAVIGDEVLDTGFHVTTPDAPDVQRYLARMVAAGLTHVVLETTSHGLAQHRVDASQYDIAVVTNITHEHLDQHGSYENYRAAKGRLFELLADTVEKPGGNPRLGVLNLDDEASYSYLHSITANQVCYGLTPIADIYAENIRYDPSGLRFDVVGTTTDGETDKRMRADKRTRARQGMGTDFRVPVTSNLVGAYNVSNCLAAFSAAVAGLGIDPWTAARGIAALTGIPGRMERIDLGQAFTAIVDFAHTPNALKVSLETARQMTLPSLRHSLRSQRDAPALPPHAGEGGRVIVVFGSAGLRDHEKRRLMAETSAQLADVSVLTAEDPRTESLDGILDEMAAGARSQGAVEGRSFFRIRDRGAALRFAARMARPGDLVIACGKGHEQSMCFGTIEYPWDDRAAMRAALAELLDMDGVPPMPYLPTQDEKK